MNLLEVNDLVDKIAMIGLGPMGHSLALNMINNGINVIGFDISEDARKNSADAGIPIANSYDELAKSFEGQKAFWVMVPSFVVDDVLEELRKYLSEGDIVIEGGNSYFKDTDRRVKEANDSGLVFIGTGVSGGEEGALKGPSIMPGGDRGAYDAIADILSKIAAKVNDDPCVTYMGPRGAGHFVKMVHNGIEYSIMQAIAEAYQIMVEVLGMSHEEMHSKFKEWSESERLGGFLTEITAEILETKDKKTGKPILDVMKDTAGNKGTGKWTSQTAYDLGVPVPSISAALNARILSSYKEEREQASEHLNFDTPNFSGDKDAVLNELEQALHSSFIIAHAQGFHMIRAASDEYDYSLNMEDIARIWRGGCILRAKLLYPIMEAFADDPNLRNLMLSRHFLRNINEATQGLRKIVSLCASHGIGVPVLSQSLNYFDSYRRKRLLPASMIQGQRDNFGAHTYQRVDEDGTFHTLWSGDKSEVRK